MKPFVHFHTGTVIYLQNITGVQSYGIIFSVPKGLLFRSKIGGIPIHDVIKGLLADRVSRHDNGRPVGDGNRIHSVEESDDLFHRVQEISLIGLFKKMDNDLAVAARLKFMLSVQKRP